MTKRYTAEFLENEFKTVAKARIRSKERGKQEYAGDAGYWTGGRCEWGGSHNLREDCETLARLFEKLTDLKETKSKLTKFDNEEQFNSVKQKLITECQRIISNLNQQTQYSYIGGVCIIWGDFKSHVESLKNTFNQSIVTLKRDIERTSYNEAKELKVLEAEENQLKREVEENERKAANETNSTKRSHFLLLADEAKVKWKKILERKKKLKLSRLGDNFDPDEFVKNFVQGIKDKINNKPPRNFPNPNDPNSPDTPNPNFPNSPNDLLNPFQTTHSTYPDWFQKNKTLIILAGAILLLLLYFSSHSEPEPTKAPSFYDYDF